MLRTAKSRLFGLSTASSEARMASRFANKSPVCAGVGSQPLTISGRSRATRSTACAQREQRLALAKQIPGIGAGNRVVVRPAPPRTTVLASAVAVQANPTMGERFVRRTEGGISPPAPRIGTRSVGLVRSVFSALGSYGPAETRVQRDARAGPPGVADEQAIEVDDPNRGRNHVEECRRSPRCYGSCATAVGEDRPSW